MHELMRRSCYCPSHVHGGRQGPDTAHHRTARHHATKIEPAGNALTNLSMKPVLILAFALAVGALTSPSPTRGQSCVVEGQKFTFYRSNGNRLTCDEREGGALPGTVGPPLKD